MKLPLLFSLSLTFAVPLAHAEILHVSKSGGGTDGASWATAFNSVGEAIEAASAEDILWVASGTYNESLLMKDQVSMYGGFAGTENEEELALRDWRKNETILDATGLNDRVLVGADRTELDGFTITRGKRPYDPFVNGGSGMSCDNVTMTIRNCYFHHNGEPGGPGKPQPAIGGGLFCIDSTLIVEGCVFLNNSASDGGAVFANATVTGSEVCLVNCLIDHNASPAYGSTASKSRFINCSFGPSNCCNRNHDDFFGSGSSFFVNCVSPKGAGGTRDVEYSLTPSSTEEGNIDADPMWVDPENGDYRLQAGSPCIDAGTRVEVLTDLDGNPRPVDVAGRGHEGETSYDMGCFEFQLNPADLDADGYVNGRDLLLFQNQWRDSE